MPSSEPKPSEVAQTSRRGDIITSRVGLAAVRLLATMDTWKAKHQNPHFVPSCHVNKNGCATVGVTCIFDKLPRYRSYLLTLWEEQRRE